MVKTCLGSSFVRSFARSFLPDSFIGSGDRCLIRRFSDRFCYSATDGLMDGGKTVSRPNMVKWQNSNAGLPAKNGKSGKSGMRD